MTADERMQLKHPEGKRMPSVPRAHFAIVRKLILETVPATAPGMSWTDMRAAVDTKLGKKLGGANNWWTIHGVKLHLEAVGELKRASESPQRLVRTRRRG